MMHFQLTPEQELFRASVRRTLDDFGKRSGGAALRKALVDLGATLCDIPEAAGGLGGVGVETSLILEEFGRMLVTEPFTASVIHAGTLLSETGAAPDLLEGLIDGSRLTVVASAEAEGGGDPLEVAASAKRTADGYRLVGRKSVVIGAPDAGSLLVTARSVDGSFTGLGLWRVDAPEAARLAICRTLDGYRAADILLDDLELPTAALVATDCDAALAKATDAALVATCAEAVGAMEAALWLTNDYLKQREQFGATIGSFQALQHRMADAYVLVEQARSALYAALSVQAAGQLGHNRRVAAAKALIGRTGKALSADMVQLHGGIGLTEEYDIGHYHRRLVAIEARFGSSDLYFRRVAGLADQHHALL